MIKFTPKIKNILSEAYLSAGKFGYEKLTPEIFFYRFILTENTTAYSCLEKNLSNVKDLANFIESRIEKRPNKKLCDSNSEELDKVFEKSESISKKVGAGFIGTEHILLALLQEKSIKELMEDFGMNIPEFSAFVYKETSLDMSKIEDDEDDNDTKTEQKNEVKDRPTEVKVPSTKMLNRFSVNLTEKAKNNELPPISGREIESNRMMQILARKTKNNPVLVGEPGVGKTSIVELLAQKIIKNEVPEHLLDVNIYALDIGLLVAGSKYRGEFEQRIKGVMEEIKSLGRKAIVFIDEIHTIVGAGDSEGGMNVGNILKPALARGEFSCIGATTYEEYRKYIEKDSALERRFSPIKVDEPSVEECTKVLKELKNYYEKFHCVKYSNEALFAAAKLSDEYITGRFLPDKAIDLIDEAGAIKRSNIKKIKSLNKISEKINSYKEMKDDFVKNGNFNSAKQKEKEIAKLEIDFKKKSFKGKNIVGITDIQKVISNWCGVPISNIQYSSGNLSSLEESLNQKVLGQKEAIKKIVKRFKRSNTPFKDKNKPIGSFLFFGESGVGKTFLAKQIAKEIFGEKKFLELDMSEYKDSISVNKIIGSPPGYIGFENGGVLVNFVRQNPHSLILFDEIEEAHPDVIKLLLQILEEGRITDSNDKTAYFNNCLIIATSNIGNRQNSKSVGFGASSDAEKNKKESVAKFFTEKVSSRFSDIINFEKLSKDDFRKIIKNKLNSLKQGLSEHKISISYSHDFIEDILRKNADKENVRDVNRFIESEIEEVLSDAYLEKKIKSNNKYFLTFDEEKFIFEKVSKEIEKKELVLC